MEPVFLDFHVHTSTNFEKPNEDYNLAKSKGQPLSTTESINSRFSL